MLSHTRRAVLGCLALSSLALLGACGPNARQTALKTSLVSLNAARDGFVQWDKQKQTTIVEDAKTLDEGKAALKAYRAKRAPVVEGFTVAYSALALAALDDNMARLTEAITTASALYQLIKSLTGDAVKTPEGGTDGKKVP
jgi:nitrogen fixation/metabolism regulation signal transduction histidine kinase